MNILLTILIVVAITIAIILIAALFVKNEYLIEKEIIVDKQKLYVFNYIKMLKNQKNYSKWEMMDPNMKQ